MRGELWGRKGRWLLMSLALLLVAQLMLPGLTEVAAASAAEEVARVAQSLVGKPYRYGAASPEQGFDSSGLVWYVYQQAGITLNRTVASQAKQGEFVKKSQLQTGDLVFFGTSTSKPQLVGIYIGQGQFVAADTKGVAVKNLSDKLYTQYYLGAKRVLTTASTPAPAAPEEKSEQPAQTSLADQIIAFGLKYLGTPYQFGARSGQTSTFDCSSFTQYVYGMHGIQLPRNSRQQSQVGKRISVNELQKGDLLFFSLSGTGRIDHVAIYMGDNQLLHAITKGVSVSKINSYWEKGFVQARRVIGQ